VSLSFDDIRKLIISPNATLKMAMKVLTTGSEKVLFVVNESDKLVGSLTDGDIRRAILNDMGFDVPVADIMFKMPRFVRHMDKKMEEAAKTRILNDRVPAIPVLDEMDRIVDILFWYDFFDSHPLESHVPESLTNPVVIMAGGKGERLDPFTKILPKPLIPFGDKPIIEKIMDDFSKYGLRRFILTLNYKKEFIKAYFSENPLQYDVSWVEEENYLGTAGSLALLKDKLKETFFVCNCDTILENDFNSMLLWHKGEKALITIIGCHKEMVIPYGSLEMSGGSLKRINEKPQLDLIINTGVYILEPEVLSFISPGEKMDMNHLIEKVMERGKVGVYPVYTGWFDMGQWKEYKDSLYLLQNGSNKPKHK